MEYFGLWLSILIAQLLLVANLSAWVGRWRWKVAAVLVVILFTLAILAVCEIQSAAVQVLRLSDFLFYSVQSQMGLFGMFGAWIAIDGLMAVEGDLGLRKGGRWPRGKLAVALSASIALLIVAVWQLDRATLQHLDALHAENVARVHTGAPPRRPETEDAAQIYAKAFQTMGESKDWPKLYHEEWLDWLQGDSDNFDPTDPELREFLRQKEESLRILHLASTRASCRFERDYDHPSMDMLLPEYHPMRDAVRLLSLDARCKAADGNLRSALANCRCIFVMAEHASFEPLCIAQMLSAAFDGVACTNLQAVLLASSPTLDDLEEFDIRTDYQHLAVLYRVLPMEQALLTVSLSDIAIGTGKLDEFTKTPFWRAFGAPLYRYFVFDAEYDAMSGYMQRASEWADEPYFAIKPKWAAITADLDTAPGFATRLLFPAIGLGAEAAARADANRRLARLAIAAYRFQATHGKLPNAIQELAPGFIAAIPQDPFIDAPLRMKSTDQGCTFYSVGTDETDDNGTPFVESTKAGDYTFEVKKASAAAAPRQ